MVNVCKDFGINYVVLDANNSVEQNVDEVTKILQKLENEQDK
jgi:deoxyguanosine kinase